MNINIYYGGRGLVDDPTISVIGKIQEVLEELNVKVVKYNLYELKNTIPSLSQTVNEADGVILATTVEWLGMGGYMQTFLDSCWLYSDKSKIVDTYMFPVVMARTYGEKEVALTFSNAWEMLGGKVAKSLTAYVDETTDFEFNKEYTAIIERYAEDIYRTISKSVISLPSSSKTIRKSIVRENLNFTPQETEQLSKYASDDTFVKTQKEDIESLASIYKELLNDQENGGDDYYLNSFKDNYVPDPDFSSSYMLIIADKDKSIDIRIDNGSLEIGFGENMEAEVIAKMSKDVFDQIVEGRVTFHRAFMTGDMTAKGNLKTLRMLDGLFKFN